eukprot:6307155-Pyramimonas_sp.AAC.1
MPISDTVPGAAWAEASCLRRGLNYLQSCSQRSFDASEREHATSTNVASHTLATQRVGKRSGVTHGTLKRLEAHALRCFLGPIRRSKREYILTTDQSDAGCAGIFSRRTNQTQEAWVHSHDGPVRRRKR